MKHRKINYELLASISDLAKIQALRNIKRDGLLYKPEALSNFASKKTLKDIKDEVESSKIMNGIAKALPEKIQNIAVKENNLIKITEGEYQLGGVIKEYADEITDERWVVFYSCFFNLEPERSEKSLETVLNHLNSTLEFGSWDIIKDKNINEPNKEEQTMVSMHAVGFLLEKNKWSFKSEIYASKMLLEHFAFILESIDSEIKSEVLEVYKLNKMEENLQEDAPLEKKIESGVYSYLNHLKEEIGETLKYKKIENFHLLNIPLKSKIAKKSCELAIGTHSANHVGVGTMLLTKLPSEFSQEDALMIVKKLNSSDEDSDTITKTTPTLTGVWFSKVVDESFNKNEEIWYRNFIPNSQENEFTIEEHLKGTIEEISNGWPVAESTLVFNSIINNKEIKNV